MIQVFKTDEEYVKWLDGQKLPSGIVVYVSDDETMYFSTNNIKGELKTYKCEKEEPIQYPPLIYSAKSAGSKLTVNGQSVTLGQGDNMVLEYPTAITSVKATNNTALTAITIPNTVVSINDNAFTGCTELTDFRYNGTVEEWGAITLGNGWKDNAAFTVVHCTDGDVSLEEPIQPTPLIYSAKSAGSTIKVNGETVTLAKGNNIVLDYPTEITSVAATNNTALTYIQIPNTVTTIKDFENNDGAFYACTSLSSVTLPDTMTFIGAKAFDGCSALASINIPDGVTSIGGSAFSNCSALASITIPEGATFIGSNIFSNCSALASINIPSGVTKIADQTFVNCTSLTSIDIPDGVTSIGMNAFGECSSLVSVNIPNSVTKINGYAFANCSKLTDFNYNGTTAQWPSITKGTDWKYNAPFTVVHCTDGDVTV